MNVQGLPIPSAARPKFSAKAKTEHQTALNRPSDAFVRFGAADSESVDPKVRNKTFAERIVSGTFHLPGGKSIADYLDYWARNDYTDNYLLTYLPNNLSDGVNANRFPPETVKAALEAGLQEAFDGALERNVDYGRPGSLLIAGDSEEYKMHHVGRMGSKKFLPVLKNFIEGDNMEKRHQAYAALSWMTQSVDLDQAREAKKLRAAHETELAHDMLEHRKPNCYAYLGKVARSGSADASRLIGVMWDEYLVKYKKEESQNSETTERFVNHFAELLSSGAPGANEVINARKTELLAYLDKKITTKPVEYSEDHYGREKHQVLKAALFATTLDELPPRQRPEGLDDDRHWLFEDDQSYFEKFPPAVAAMAARGVPGAAEKLAELETERDDFLIGQFEKFLTGHTVTYTSRETGLPEVIKEFDDYRFRRELMPMAAQYASPRLIPMLERVLNEPWAPIERCEWWTSGADYTTDRTAGTKARITPQIQGLIDDIKLRHGLL